jgi:peroxin-5
LARTARDLVNDLDTSSEILRDNPKLAQSQFMQLMRGLGNGEVVVEDGKARINGEEINEGAKFVSRPAGDWASAFVAAPAKEDFQQVRTLPATLDMPTFEERMRFGQDTMYTDQSAITHPTEAEAHRPGGMRRKSVHFDEADMSQALGSGVPNNLEEALRSSTSIPGMQASWEGGLDFDDFDETSFMNYNGQLRQSTDDPKGVGQVENWGGLQRDWEDFQRSNPMVKGGQTDRYLFQTRNPYASMAEDADLGRESPTLKVSLHHHQCVVHS